MKFNWVILLATVLLLTITLNAQKTYFIKYKSSVPIDVVELNISQQKLSNKLGDAPLALPSYNINYLAKGMGRGDEVLGRIVKIQFAQDVDAANFNSIIINDPDIEYIQEANIYKVDAITPNDSLLSDQWALEKIKAFDAWEITQGSDSVLLAIIDTGIDYIHPDLKNKIYINPGESGTKSNNGIDDDNNGFVDDYMGWDFTDRLGFPFDSTGGDYLNWDNDPNDEQGHGTYISGIAAAETNNLTGVAGVAPKIKVLNLRAFDPGGYGEEDDVASAILYAIKMNCKVINMSFGDNAFSLVLRDVIRYAYSQGLVLVASSGNSGSSDPHYPSGYSEVICVGNSTPDDFVSGSSNYGSTLDLVAPGTFIVTTARDNNYASINGTSASAPFVSAAASLILSKQSFSNEEVKQILKSTSDDISESGWDLRSGAGRLNLFKALSVTAPSLVKFHNPTQDFATSGNVMPISISVISPYFVSFDLDWGVGFNPNKWNSILSNQLNQVDNDTLANLDITGLKDTVYTLRVVVHQTNGRTLEERINFHIDRSAPDGQVVSVIPAFYGDKTTILASVVTDDPSIVKMYYRIMGDSNFNFVTLDGFTINNQFVKSLHYGFLPKDLVQQNVLYEIYFEAINLVGLTTTLKNGADYFIVPTSFEAEFISENKLPFSLPSGSIYEDELSLSGITSKEIILRTNDNPKVSGIYTFNNDNFSLIDSLNEKIVKDAGDFNKNGLMDILDFFVRDGFIDEQSATNSTSFVQKYSNTNGSFWPIFAKDIDNDNITELFSVKDDTTIDVWEVSSNLTLNSVATLKNYSESKFGYNIINSPNAVVDDIDNDGIKEFWMIDQDGDLFSYNITGNNQFTKKAVIPTEFLGSSAHLTSGDFDGDGRNELAVLLHSLDELDISPFYRIVIFNLVGSDLNMILDQGLIDASTEFNNTFRQSENSIRLTDIDGDAKDELILFVFPYAYIIKNDFLNYNKIISYRENINSNSIFVGDLNNNGIKEIAFPNLNEIEFIEFGSTFQTSRPYNLNGYSNSSSEIYLKWSGFGERFFIYKGTDENNLQLIDSLVYEPSYIDPFINLNTSYYYAVKAYDPSKPEPLSGLSSIIKVYAHTPAKPIDAVSNSNRSVIVKFSEKMNNTIENLQAFNIDGVGYPNSVTANDQYSYLISYNQDLPAGSQSIIIKDLKDLYGSPIETDTLTFDIDPVIQAENFYISSFEIVNSFKIKLAFNYPVDQTSAMNVNNYSFEPENKVSSVSIDQTDPKIIYLDLSGNKPIGSIGKEYVLRLTNLVSSQASGNILINSGAGSFVVLSAYAKDLSDVYVYPNPTTEGAEKVTFANLPQKSKITIWSVDGKLINEIEETDGNGGVDYDLKDFSGNNISSGIYIFRIVMLDELNNEGEEKLGKFAVVR
jgi:subtilisin family serine protease